MHRHLLNKNFHGILRFLYCHGSCYNQFVKLNLCHKLYVLQQTRTAYKTDTTYQFTTEFNHVRQIDECFYTIQNITSYKTLFDFLVGKMFKDLGYCRYELGRSKIVCNAVIM